MEATDFGLFDPPQQSIPAPLKKQETNDDPIAAIKADFQQAQRRQREARPRKGVQS